MTELTIDRLKALQTDRNVIERKLQRVYDFVERFTDEIDLVELTMRFDRLKVIEANFETVQREIESFHQDADDEAVRDNFETRLMTTQGRITNILNLHKPEPAQVTPSKSAQVPVSLRLPELNLPRFGGRYTEWFSFANSFKSLVHKNIGLTDCEKLHYLRSQLSGDALRTVDSLEVSNENYETAWALLTRRFENERLIVHEHVNQILNAKPIGNRASIELRALIDKVRAHVGALNVLRIPTSYWDAILVPVVTSKFDVDTSREWQSRQTTKVPTFESLLEFAERRFQILESIEASNTRSNRPPNESKQVRKFSAHVSTDNKSSCVKCKEAHFLYRCPSFQGLSTTDRVQFVKRSNLCFNCLSPGHSAKQCNSSNCRKCNKHHHTLLHPSEAESEPRDATKTREASVSNHSANIRSQVLLSTAVVLVKDAIGKFRPGRALLDVGSQANFLRKTFVDELGLKTKPVQHSICGVNQVVNTVHETAEIEFKSHVTNYQTSISCFVLPEITQDLPVVSIPESAVRVPRGIILADRHFHKSATIDLLIGVALFWELLLTDRIRLSRSEPTFAKTKLGWIVGGAIEATNPLIKTSANFVANDVRALEERVGKFLELEECANKVENHWSPEQLACEEHFRDTHTRASDGRFIVQLPKKDEIKLGASYKMAKNRLLNLERKFKRSPELKVGYIAFMEEYERLGHMALVSEQEFAAFPNHYFLPHHPVLKPASVTTKLRVVFDASARSTNGLSLNDNLMCGPTVQEDLFSILIRFRCFKYVVGADVTKMYRQIRVDESDKRLQLVLWRKSSEEPICTYKLQTVTYGTKPASFQSTRCLQELARQAQVEFPAACDAILHNTYMDDVIAGTDDISSAMALRDDLIKVFARDGETNVTVVNFDKNFDTKALGLSWNCMEDTLKFDPAAIHAESRKLTKRTILSTLASVFDPLGLAGPVVTRGKIILRELWNLKQSWDQTVPPHISAAWEQFSHELAETAALRIERPITISPRSRIEIHGFSEASIKAYGAAVYIRSESIDGDYVVRLLCAKSRVAPQRSISLPRLALCAAHLLAKLVNKVTNCLSLNVSKKYYWTDSSIVLAWLAASPSNWQTFVANRVAEIQTLSVPSEWFHVVSENNPADLISRGTALIQSSTQYFWFHGPKFLSQSKDAWPKPGVVYDPTDAPEALRISLSCSTVPEELISIERFSKLHRLQRATAFVFRFVRNCRVQERLAGPLSVDELHDAMNYLVRRVQASSFSHEVASLSKSQPLGTSSRLLSLSPFLDKHGLLRVGGRLENANITFNARHPVLLPRDQPLTTLIIRAEHERQLHAGPLATLASIRQRFWVLSGRSAVKKVLRNCVRCFRANPKRSVQKMGQLPCDRLTPSRPFSVSGVDYAGPILIRDGKGRIKRLVKAYIAVFVCFASKALHLELVNDLTSEAFLNSLRRMIARRGHVSKLYSDNATNFVGARRELRDLFNFFKSSQFDGVLSELATQSIEWNFIPPGSPHMGGLWEAGVKSVKTHLKRLTASAELNYEEMQTLLCRIEACLNSRPISPLSSDPDDLLYLTPGHFLIGGPMTSFAEPNLVDIQMNRLSRWQLVERLRQQFWRRWNHEYLGQLQIRSKWLRQTTDLQVGDLVVIVEDHLPPLHWKLGRVAVLHPGKDGLVRVVTVRVARGQVKRAIHKLCVLPLKTSERNTNESANM